MKKNIKREGYWLFEGGFMYACELRDCMGKRIASIMPNPLPGQCYEGHTIHFYSPRKKGPIKTLKRKDLNFEAAKRLAENFAKGMGYKVADKREIDLDDYDELLKKLKNKIIKSGKGNAEQGIDELEERAYMELIKIVSKQRRREDLKQEAKDRLDRIFERRSKSKNRTDKEKDLCKYNVQRKEIKEELDNLLDKYERMMRYQFERGEDISWYAEGVAHAKEFAQSRLYVIDKLEQTKEKQKRKNFSLGLHKHR